MLLQIIKSHYVLMHRWCLVPKYFLTLLCNPQPLENQTRTLDYATCSIINLLVFAGLLFWVHECWDSTGLKLHAGTVQPGSCLCTQSSKKCYVNPLNVHECTQHKCTYTCMGAKLLGHAAFNRAYARIGFLLRQLAIEVVYKSIFLLLVSSVALAAFCFTCEGCCKETLLCRYQRWALYHCLWACTCIY